MESIALVEKPQVASIGYDTRTALVVCGMHRSGTSALARVISLLGAELPKGLYPGEVRDGTGIGSPRWR